jgi:hypothetical protein
MADLISLAEAQAWAEPTKLTLDSLDSVLLGQVQSLVLSRVAIAYPTDVVLWIGPGSTPSLIRTIISMLYVSWYIDRTYSQNADLSAYAARLAGIVESNIIGIVDGTIDIIEIVTDIGSATDPAFYPNDTSSALDPTFDDMSLGDAKFSMGRGF